MSRNIHLLKFCHPRISVAHLSILKWLFHKDIRQSIGHHDHDDLYHKSFSHYLFPSVVEISFVTDFLIQLFSFCNFLSSKEILITFLSVFSPILS